MARYAFDEELRTLIVTWGTGAGDAARTLTRLPAEVPGKDAWRLVRELSGLSEVLWRTYTHPPGAVDSLEDNTEGWRREQARERLSSVPDFLRKPNLPSPDGSMIVSYVAVEEAAHRVGRVLHRIGSAELTEVVVAEVGTELKAIGDAELGDLTGRAVHAVTLTRAGASPAQIAIADKMLEENPLGGDALFTELDPAASAVAAAHWLQAAADVAAEVSELDPTGIVLEADNIEALPHETPTAVLEALGDGASPYEIVVKMIGDAMRVAEGGPQRGHRPPRPPASARSAAALVARRPRSRDHRLGPPDRGAT
jgi:hypothetical protein